MPVHRGNIAEVIENAWQKAQEHEIDSGNKRDDNKRRSRKWLCCLASEFEKQYSGNRHRIFWIGSEKNKEHFKRNEFLFDMVVCSTSTTKSLQTRAQELQFIAECHWQVESEFSRGNTRDVVVDMSKLVVGSAENKLFVASHQDEKNERMLEQCSEIAGRCDGRIYFSFVSHPDDWYTKRSKDPSVYEWVSGGWDKIS